MKLQKGFILFLTILLLLGTKRSDAQFVYEGRDRIGIKWEQIRAHDHRMIYPDYYRQRAIGLSNFLDTVSPHIRHGFPYKTIFTPIILRTEGLLSNGFVVWAPKRSELVMAPPVSNYAMPWAKQLAIHEWRHVVQLSSLNTGITKVATWILGEAGLSLGMLMIGKWQLEGDAVNAETQLAEYGRGLQPDFTVEYRAMVPDPKFLNYTDDFWVCGSYRKHVPDIYKYGYQIMTAGEIRFGTDIWGKVFRYSAKWPILIVPDRIYFKRHHGVTLGTIKRNTFAEMKQHWMPLADVENNFETLTPPERSYTIYSYPMPMPNGNIIANKVSFDQSSALVSIDGDGRQTKLTPTGNFSSRPALSGNTIYWTEHKPHPIWEQKNGSVIRSFDLATERSKYHAKREINLFVTPLPDGNFASVSIDSLSDSFLRLKNSGMSTIGEYRFDRPTTIHGLAFDPGTSILAFIALDGRGMWIGGMDYDNGKLSRPREITKPSVVTVSNLTASGGRLYFGSIASGKDEIHTLDLVSGKEYQLTSSRFGSYDPTSNGREVLFTTYSADGYSIATTTSDTCDREAVEWSRLPKNLVNLPRTKWDVPKTDTLVFTDTTNREIKRFRRWGRVFNVHSWAPVALDVKHLMDEQNLDIGFGATAVFQSTLSDMRGHAAYGWRNNQNWLNGQFTYTGLPVEISVGADYGGGKRLIYTPGSLIDQEDTPKSSKPYFSTNAAILLPLNLSRGANLRLLRPSFAVTHYNALLYNADGSYDTGYQKYDAMLLWSNYLRPSYRSLAPRLGYSLRAGVSGGLSSRFSTLYSLLGRAWLPGLTHNHSIRIDAGAQTQNRKEFAFSSKVLTPRGITDNYGTQRYYGVSANYTLPLFYPDWGWNGALNFKRVWTNLFFDYSCGDYYASRGGTIFLDQHSYGVDIGIDLNVLRSTFSQGVIVTLAKPSTGNSVWVGLGISLGL